MAPPTNSARFLYLAPKIWPTNTPPTEMAKVVQPMSAAAVPMEILELSCRVIALQEEFAALGSSLAVSDAGTGAVFAWAAMYGAALNVLANTRLMADRERACELEEECEQLLERWLPRADALADAAARAVRGRD